MTASGVVGGLILAATGAYLGVATSGTPVVQLNQVIHILVGWILLIPMVVATLQHHRVRGRNLTGLLVGALTVLVIGTGAAHSAFVFAGLAGPEILLTVHLFGSMAFAGLTVWHIVAALKRRPKARWPKRWAAPAVVATLLAAGIAVATGLWLDSERATAAPASYDMPFGDNPFRPANVQIIGENTTFISPDRLAGSIRCRTCHEEIYTQWSESMHRYSATDPHVDTGIRWFQRDNGAAAGRQCAGCHNPIGLLAGWYDSATSPPDVGTSAHDEGISCLSCHAVVGVGDDPFGNGSYHIEPPELPLLDGVLGDALIHLDVAAHKSAMMKPIVRTAKFCGSCHQQYFSEEFGGAGPSMPFSQYSEWLDTHYAKDGPDKKTCNDCHMPLVTSSDPSARNGVARSHRFVGANHAHAVASGHEQQAAETLTMLRLGVEMSLAVAVQQTVPNHVEVVVSVSNTGVGHRFPSGTTDISEAWIEVIAGDPSAPHFATGLLDNEHYLDPDAYSWRTVYVDINNVPVDLHNLAVVANTTMDAYVDAGETDTARFAIPIPKSEAGALKVRARLRLRKANQRWNDWLSNFDGSTVPITDIHEREISVSATQLPKSIQDSATTVRTPPALPPAPGGMVGVPGGPAIIGSTYGDADEKPVRTLEVPSFFFDR
ncbi:MAG: hypothetical protein ACI9OJ_000215, partial [Myxococcota bacterium]